VDSIEFQVFNPGIHVDWNTTIISLTTTGTLTSVATFALISSDTAE
jgi:hypothetical protein